MHTPSRAIQQTPVRSRTPSSQRKTPQAEPEEGHNQTTYVLNTYVTETCTDRASTTVSFDTSGTWCVAMSDEEWTNLQEVYLKVLETHLLTEEELTQSGCVALHGLSHMLQGIGERGRSQAMPSSLYLEGIHRDQVRCTTRHPNTATTATVLTAVWDKQLAVRQAAGVGPAERPMKDYALMVEGTEEVLSPLKSVRVQAALNPPYVRLGVRPEVKLLEALQWCEGSHRHGITYSEVNLRSTMSVSLSVCSQEIEARSLVLRAQARDFVLLSIEHYHRRWARFFYERELSEATARKALIQGETMAREQMDIVQPRLRTEAAEFRARTEITTVEYMSDVAALCQYDVLWRHELSLRAKVLSDIRSWRIEMDALACEGLYAMQTFFHQTLLMSVSACDV